MENYLADTTVLVDHLRGDEKAISFLLDASPAISFVTVAELMQEAQNKTGFQAVEQAVSNLEVIAVNKQISTQTIKLMREYFLTFNLQFLDALIASTALLEDLILVTANVKHFSFIKKLKVLAWKNLARSI